MAPTKRAPPDSEEDPSRKAHCAKGVTTNTMEAKASYSSVNTTFSLPELVENILHFLPMKDLLFAQGVCTNWKDVISTSRDLQQALYFQPAKLKFQLKYDPRTDDTTKIFPEADKGVAMGSEKKTAPPTADAATLNPLIFVGDPCYDTLDDRAAYKCQKEPSMKYPEASWRKMLVSQPPVQDATLVFGLLPRSYNELVWPHPRVLTAWDIVECKRKTSVNLSWEKVDISSKWMLFLTEQEMENSDELFGEMVEDSSDDEVD